MNKISLLKEKMEENPHGNCYIASEVAQYLLGPATWKPCVLHHEGDTHWFLTHRGTGEVLDLTVGQYTSLPDYARSRGCGFLTKGLSKRAKELLESLGE